MTMKDIRGLVWLTGIRNVPLHEFIIKIRNPAEKPFLVECFYNSAREINWIKKEYLTQGTRLPLGFLTKEQIPRLSLIDIENDIFKYSIRGAFVDTDIFKDSRLYLGGCLDYDKEDFAERYIFQQISTMYKGSKEISRNPPHFSEDEIPDIENDIDVEF